MPTILRFDGLRVVIYPNDHRPAHVHVIGPAKEAVFILDCPDGPAGLRGTYGFTRQALRAAEAALNKALVGLCEDWKAIHGDY